MKAHRLILGPLPADYHAASDRVLSPAGFIGREAEFPAWPSMEFAKLDVDQEGFLAYSENYLNESLLPNLTRLLNRRHKTNHSPLFWRTLLMPFLLELWGVSALSFLTLASWLQENQRSELTVRTLSVSEPWRFVDTLDFNHRGLMNPQFIHSRLSDYARAIAPRAWKFEDEIFSPENPKFVESVRDHRSMRFHGINGFSDAQKITLSALLSAKSWLKPSRVRPQELTFPKTQKKVSQSDYVQTLWETIFVPGFEPFAAGVLPQTVGSHFERFCRRAQKIKYKSGGLRVMGTAFYDHEQIKFYLAFAQEAGEIIIGSQHGGSYGIDRFHFSSFELEIKHKLFLSWGWESQDSVQKNVLPLSSPLCSRYAEKHRFKNDSVILVSTHIWPLGLGLYYSELIGSDWLDYVRRKIELISTFSPSLRDRFFYRAHPHKRASLSELPTLKKEFPDLKLCEGPLKNHLLSTSLLILDNPSTTLNFAAAANTPFVLVLHPKTAFCSEAEPFFRDFEKAGMLFSSPKSAAEHINRLGDIPSWWHSSEVQSARKRWCEKYARTNPQVFFEWAKTLWNL